MSMDKYTIPAKRMTNKMDTIAFKALFNEVLHKTDEFDEETPVVAFELNSEEAGNVFGVSKIKGGNMY